MLLADLRQQAICRLLYQIQHPFETGYPAIIRIRHFFLGQSVSVLQEQVQLLPMIGGTKKHQVVIIAAIHCKYVVEIQKIILANPARTLLAEIDAALPGRLSGPDIRRFPDMVGMRSRRIDLNQRSQPLVFDQVLEYPLRRW